MWRAARHLHQTLTGQVLTETDFRVPAHATLDLAGRPVVGTASRGKHLLTRIGDEHTLHTHLKMEGSWHLYRPGTRWRRPAHQARVVLRTPEWVAVGFSLGITEVVRRDEEETVVGHVGPDLLGPDWDEDEALRRLRGDPARPVGPALLDQRNLAGIGNMYMAELCFLAGIDPATPVAAVPDLRRLVRRSKQVLEHNKERIEQATTGDLRRGRTHWVYPRAGQPCRRCGTRIVTGDLAGREAFWCPRCQPLLGAAPPG
ncbi:MAG: Endonuclease VIII [uncultured Nocardioidaceae bacterium]|uniref:DNA-(apurinic or apyrimidinic site) lyase n=1 Tax=uncultured Nocardioidaceae bacterium TaxID=253824 RepID=A0A6J4MH37_9ACTN|nr:MAG: Endonuclease VIII [uncultured Nocardioidaceae bacterium]